MKYLVYSFRNFDGEVTAHGFVLFFAEFNFFQYFISEHSLQGLVRDITEVVAQHFFIEQRHVGMMPARDTVFVQNHLSGNGSSRRSSNFFARRD